MSIYDRFNLWVYDSSTWKNVYTFYAKRSTILTQSKEVYVYNGGWKFVAESRMFDGSPVRLTSNGFYSSHTNWHIFTFTTEATTALPSWSKMPSRSSKSSSTTSTGYVFTRTNPSQISYEKITYSTNTKVSMTPYNTGQSSWYIGQSDHVDIVVSNKDYTYYIGTDNDVTDINHRIWSMSMSTNTWANDGAAWAGNVADMTARATAVSISDDFAIATLYPASDYDIYRIYPLTKYITRTSSFVTGDATRHIACDIYPQTNDVISFPNWQNGSGTILRMDYYLNTLTGASISTQNIHNFAALAYSNYTYLVGSHADSGNMYAYKFDKTSDSYALTSINTGEPAEGPPDLAYAAQAVSAYTTGSNWTTQLPKY